jgi:hypothetical protein
MLKKILFAMMWMNLEDIMLCEITRHRKTNTVWSHLYMKSKKVELVEVERK